MVVHIYIYIHIFVYTYVDAHVLTPIWVLEVHLWRVLEGLSHHERLDRGPCCGLSGRCVMLRTTLFSGICLAYLASGLLFYYHCKLKKYVFFSQGSLNSLGTDGSRTS